MSAVSAYLRSHPEGCALAVRLQPGAKRNEIAGTHEEGDHVLLKISLRAQPIEGRANEALIAMLAAGLRMPKTSIVVLSGKTSRSKLILIKSCTSERMQAWLDGVAAQSIIL